MSADLKKLQPIVEMSEKSVNVAGNIYSKAKDLCPEGLKPQVNKVEDVVVATSAPYVAYAQDKSITLLKVADDRVDKAAQVLQNNTAYLQQQLGKMEEFHTKNLESYKTARETYLKRVEESVEFLKTNGISGATKVAADEVTARIGKAREIPSYVLKHVQEAFDKLMAAEPVKKTLTTVRPTVDAAYTRYISLHDSVVATAQYKRVYDLSQSVISRAQDTAIFQRAKTSLYPWVAPYADPALAQLMASPYYKAAIEHITPATPVA